MTAEMTEKDRAPLASRAVGNSAKTGVSIPTPNGVVISKGHAVTDGAFLAEGKPAREKESTINGSAQYRLNGTKEIEEVHGDKVSLTGHAEDVSTPRSTILKSVELF